MWRSKQTYFYLFVALFLVVFGMVYYLYDPSASTYFPKCPFRMLTGLECAGCGSQRAIHSMLHLEFRAAFAYNPLVVVMTPVLMVLATASLLKEKYPKFYNITHHPLVAQAILVIVLLWWAYRLLIC